MKLDKSEFERLLELAALADWVVNGHRPEEERLAVNDDALQKLYSTAEEEGLGYLVALQDGGTWGPSEALMARLDLAGHVADYDECVFWDELAIRLAERDLRAEMGEAVFHALPPAVRQERVDELAAAYDREFDVHGLDRVHFDRARRARATRDGLTERLLKLFGDDNS